jgi:hypothetical protein
MKSQQILNLIQACLHHKTLRKNILTLLYMIFQRHFQTLKPIWVSLSTDLKKINK